MLAWNKKPAIESFIVIESVKVLQGELTSEKQMDPGSLKRP
jgi:hypothetical protein